MKNVINIDKNKIDANTVLELCKDKFEALIVIGRTDDNKFQLIISSDYEYSNIVFDMEFVKTLLLNDREEIIE